MSNKTYLVLECIEWTWWPSTKIIHTTGLWPKDFTHNCPRAID